MGTTRKRYAWFFLTPPDKALKEPCEAAALTAARKGASRALKQLGSFLEAEKGLSPSFTSQQTFPIARVKHIEAALNKSVAHHARATHFVYFHGHGKGRKRDEKQFVASAASEGPDFAMSLSEFAERIESLAKSLPDAKFIFVLDFCYSGAVVERLEALGLDKNVRSRLVVIAACEPEQIALPHDKRKALPHMLLRVLNQAVLVGGTFKLHRLVSDLYEEYESQTECNPIVYGSKLLGLVVNKAPRRPYFGPGVQSSTTGRLPDPKASGAEQSWEDAHVPAAKGNVDRQYRRTLAVGIECWLGWMTLAAEELLGRVTEGVPHGAHKLVVAEAFRNLAQIASFKGDVELAKQNMISASLITGEEDKTAMGKHLFFEGLLSRFEGRPGEALVKYQEAAKQLDGEVLGKLAKMDMIMIRGLVPGIPGVKFDPRKSLQEMMELSKTLEERRVRRYMMSVTYKIGLLNLRCDKTEEAESALQTARDLLDGEYQPNWSGNFLALEALVAFSRKEVDRSFQLIQEAWFEYRKISFIYPIALTSALLIKVPRAEERKRPSRAEAREDYFRLADEAFPMASPKILGRFCRGIESKSFVYDGLNALASI